MGAEAAPVADDQKLRDLAGYILTTEEMGLTYHKGPSDANPRVMLKSWASSADASWSMCPTENIG